VGGVRLWAEPGSEIADEYGAAVTAAAMLAVVTDRPGYPIKCIRGGPTFDLCDYEFERRLQCQRWPN
jgi:hypothetical protein